ncbi:MAG: DUF502 domain-containing protein [Chlamydiae bacterium]|nr:DUF502 domain-containing protein [Chlamydiota bacterium]
MGKIFKRGLLAVAPSALTLVFVFWLFNALEALFRPAIETIVGTAHYFPGMGILAALILIFFVGTFVNNWFLQKISRWGESLVTKIPLVKTLYNSIVEMMRYFSPKDAQKRGAVVLVEVLGMKLVGLITRDSFEGLPQGLGEDGEVAVYLPMSYQIGGYTVVVPKSRVTILDMTVEEGMRYAVTAGVLTQGRKGKPL